MKNLIFALLTAIGFVFLMASCEQETIAPPIHRSGDVSVTNNVTIVNVVHHGDSIAIFNGPYINVGPGGVLVNGDYVDGDVLTINQNGNYTDITYNIAGNYWVGDDNRFYDFSVVNQSWTVITTIQRFGDCSGTCDTSRRVVYVEVHDSIYIDRVDTVWRTEIHIVQRGKKALPFFENDQPWQVMTFHGTAIEYFGGKGQKEVGAGFQWGENSTTFGTYEFLNKSGGWLYYKSENQMTGQTALFKMKEKTTLPGAGDSGTLNDKLADLNGKYTQVFPKDPEAGWPSSFIGNPAWFPMYFGNVTGVGKATALHCVYTQGILQKTEMNGTFRHVVKGYGLFDEKDPVTGEDNYYIDYFDGSRKRIADFTFPVPSQP